MEEKAPTTKNPDKRVMIMFCGIVGFVVLLLVTWIGFGYNFGSESDKYITETSVREESELNQENNTYSLPEHSIPKDQLPETVIPIKDLPEDYVEDVASQVGGDDVDKRLTAVFDKLHSGGSGDFLRASFPDLQYLLKWTPIGVTKQIFPFFYYYSPEADTTFVVCNIDKTVAICDGLQNSAISEGDLGKCTLARPFEKFFGAWN